MRKPTTFLSIISAICAFLGIAISGEPLVKLFITGASISEAENGLLITGLCTIFLSAILLFISFKREQIRKEIVSDGLSVTGKITGIKHMFHISWGNNSHPYVVTFLYEFKGTSYKGKSNLLWAKSNYKKDEDVVIFIDRYDPNKYAVLL